MHDDLGTRRATAPLEMVMVLPALILAWLLIMQVGGSCVRQAEVIVEARQAAWSDRDQRSGDNPFDFAKSIGGDRIEKSKSASVNFSGISSLFPAARSRHQLIAGTWAHPAIDLNEQPNFELALKLARLGPVQEAKGRLADIERLIRALGAIRDAAESLRFDWNSLGNLVSAFQGLASDADWKTLAGDMIADEVARFVSELQGGNSGFGEVARLIQLIQGKRDTLAAAEKQATAKSDAAIDQGIQTVNGSGMGLGADSQQKLAGTAEKLDQESESPPDLSKETEKRRITELLDQLQQQADQFLAAGNKLKSNVDMLFRAEQMADKKSVNAAAVIVRDRFVKTFPDLAAEHQALSEQIKTAREQLKKDDAKELQTTLKDLSKSTGKLQQSMASLEQRRLELIDVLQKSKAN